VRSARASDLAEIARHHIGGFLRDPEAAMTETEIITLVGDIDLTQVPAPRAALHMFQASATPHAVIDLSKPLGARTAPLTQ